MSGTAILGTDYILSGTPGQVTFAPNQNSVSVTISAFKDGIKEPEETAIMTVPNAIGAPGVKSMKVRNKN